MGRGYMVCSCIRALKAVVGVLWLLSTVASSPAPVVQCPEERMNAMVGGGAAVRVEKRAIRSWSDEDWREAGVRIKKGWWVGSAWAAVVGWGGMGRARSWVWRVVSWSLRVGWRVRWGMRPGRSGRWRRVVLNMLRFLVLGRGVSGDVVREGMFAYEMDAGCSENRKTRRFQGDGRRNAK